jgi:formate dehydrogenase alpha subunit
MAFGSGAMTNSIAEIEQATFILALGTNTTETHPAISLKVKRAVRQGATLLVVDPRKTELAALAARHLSIKPGSDIALLNSMAQVIIAENLYAHEFVAEHTEGFDKLNEAVAPYTPEVVSEVTGLPADAIRATAREYATAQRASILYTMGVTQHTSGTHTVLAAANLAMLCGQIGRPGTGVNPLRGQNNVQGACDMGALPDVFTGYQKVSDPAVRAKFGAAWDHELPVAPGRILGEIFEGALNGEIKGMYVIGENPVLSEADSTHVQKALKNLDFLVVQDIFLSETAEMADVVLPAASFAEKDGTFTNTERRVQRVRKAISPIGESLPDWNIICAMAKAMGSTGFEFKDPSEVMDEIAGLTPTYAGISYTHLDEKGSLQWPCRTAQDAGTAIMHRNGAFSRGKGRFHPVAYIAPAEMTDDSYPLVLSTGRRLYHYHTGTMTRRSALEERMGEDRLDVNTQDAIRLSLYENELVRLMSRRGEIDIRVHRTDDVPPGLVFTSFHFGETPVNRLTNPARDPLGGTPEFKVAAVRIEKLSGAAEQPIAAP